MPTRKLMIKYGISREIAKGLVEKGFASPAKIRAATSKGLMAVHGVGAVTAKMLKGK